MVGKGYLRPDMTRTRKDVPKMMRRLVLECSTYDREDRPLFPQVSSFPLVVLHLGNHIFEKQNFLLEQIYKIEYH